MSHSTWCECECVNCVLGASYSFVVTGDRVGVY